MHATVRVDPITSFTGEFHFLSNFYENPFTWRNIVFPSGEHAFQYAKTFCILSLTEASQKRWEEKIYTAPTPAKAKYEGRSIPLRVADWDKRKVSYMREIVHARFQTSQHDMVGRLINTGAALLVEGNDWGDTFWGRCDGKGKNLLGSILMEERGYWLKGNF